MPLQYRRVARLLVGTGTDVVEMDGLRIAFGVTKSRLGGVLPNAATIRVYNLSHGTRSKLGEAAKTVQLFAGYEGFDELLYGGQTRRPVHEREGPDWVSIFHCADRYKQSQESTISRTFPRGTSVSVILQAVADSFGSGIDSEIVTDDLGDIASARILSGGSRQALENLAGEYDFDWSWQDGRLEISGPDKTFDDESIVISPDTGMVGQPVITDAGIEVSTLLNPRIRVKRKIRVVSRAPSVQVSNIRNVALRPVIPILQDGDYVVGQVVFTGDTHGADWTARIKTYAPGIQDLA